MFNSYGVNTLQIETALCTGCGRCIEVCPHGVFAMIDHKARLAARESCMECGACALNCREDAISVESGVGCATAMIIAALKGQKEASCGCN